MHKLAGELDFYAEIRRMSDQAQRRAIIDMLFAEGVNYGLNRSTTREPKGNYTRVCSYQKLLTWTGDEEPGVRINDIPYALLVSRALRGDFI